MIGVYLLHDIFSFLVSGHCNVANCCGLSRSNNVKLSKRIIALEQDFVHAVIRIGALDFQKGPNEITANERPEGI